MSSLSNEPIYCTSCGTELSPKTAVCSECRTQVQLSTKWYRGVVYGSLLLLSVMALMGLFGEPAEGSLYHVLMSLMAFPGWIILGVSMYKDRKQVREVTDWEPWPSSSWFAVFTLFVYMGGLCGVAYWSKRYQNVNAKDYREV